MDSKALSKRPNALLWTATDSVWPSTDQEVGCSSRPWRADENSHHEAFYCTPASRALRNTKGVREEDVW